MPRFIDLPIKIIGEDHRIFFLRSPGRPLPDLDKIRPDRYMRAMFLQYTDRQDTSPAGTGQRLGPIARSQLIPSRMKLLRTYRTTNQYHKGSNTYLFHSN